MKEDEPGAADERRKDGETPVDPIREAGSRKDLATVLAHRIEVLQRALAEELTRRLSIERRAASGLTREGVDGWIGASEWSGPGDLMHDSAWTLPEERTLKVRLARIFDRTNAIVLAQRGVKSTSARRN